MKNLAVNLSTYLSQLFKSSTLSMTDYSSGTFRSNSQNNNPFQNVGMQFKKFQRHFKNSRYLSFAVVVVVVFIIAIVGISSVIKKSTTGATQTSAASNTKQAVVAQPLVTESLNKTFKFPLNNSAGKQVSQIQYEIQSAEFDNQIIVKGQIATAIVGKVFLVLNLQITNNYDKAVELNSKDYVRVIVDNSGEKLAAAVNNDPVDIEPISTTFTRLAFPIDANPKSIVLQVGQIDGPKQMIPLNLK